MALYEKKTLWHLKHTDSSMVSGQRKSRKMAVVEGGAWSKGKGWHHPKRGNGPHCRSQKIDGCNTGLVGLVFTLDSAR